MNTNADFDAMSDEEFANLAAPPEDESQQSNSQESESLDVGSSQGNQGNQGNVVDPILPSSNERVEEQQEQEQEQEQEPIDPETFYKEVTKPFIANGKQIEIRTPEEAIRLMQMGADYTRKTQQLAQHRKAIAILERNGLLDESKLDFLVALEKKDPEAVKKYLTDKQIDPLDIDLSEESKYQPGQHTIADNQLVFEEVVNQIQATEEGNNFFSELNSTLDAQSKQMLYNSPDALPVLYSQKQSGVYDLIANEIERYRVLGQLPANLSFIEAYKAVGDEMQKRGAFGNVAEVSPQPASSSFTQRVVGAPTPKIKPNPRVNAASPSKGKGVASAPLDAASIAAMSDEEIMALAAKMV